MRSVSPIPISLVATWSRTRSSSGLLRSRALAAAAGHADRTAEPSRCSQASGPEFGRGKRTTAADLGTLFAAIHLAAGGRGPLIEAFNGAITPAESRHLLFLLAHTRDRGAKLAASIPGATVAHKGGWISTARHDAGIVYWKGGAFVAAVMTFNEQGVGDASDRLAARAARTSLETFRR